MILLSVTPLAFLLLKKWVISILILPIKSIYLFFNSCKKRKIILCISIIFILNFKNKKNFKTLNIGQKNLTSILLIYEHYKH